MKKNINLFNKLKDNKQLLFTLCSILVLILLCGGVTFAIFSYNDSSDNNDINSGYISMSYVEPSNEYFVENALPMKDSQAMYLDNYFEFSVSTTVKTNEDDDNGVTIPYEITITESSGNTLTSEQIKMFVTEVDGEKEIVNLNPTLVSNLEPSIYKSEGIKVGFNLHLHRNGNETITKKYRLRAWIDYDVDASNWNTVGMYEYKFKVNVNGEANYQGFTTDQSCFAYEELGEIDGQYYYAITGYDYDRCGGNNIVVPAYIYEEKEVLYREILDVGMVDLDTAVGISKEVYFSGNCGGYVDLDTCLVAQDSSMQAFESQVVAEYLEIESQMQEFLPLKGQNYYEHKDEIDAINGSDYAQLGVVYATVADNDIEILQNVATKVYAINSLQDNVVTAVNSDDSINAVYNLNNVVGEKEKILSVADTKPYINSLIVPDDVIFYTPSVFSSYRVGKLYDTTGNFPSACYNYSVVDGGVKLKDFLCRGIENIVIPAIDKDGLSVISIADIVDNRFSNAGLKSVVIADSVLNIGDSVFSNNELEYVRLSSNLVSIGNSAFKANKLGKIELPDTITTIDNHAFQDNNLEHINIPKSLVTVGTYAFSGNEIISKLVFSDSVSNIGQYAFSGNEIEEIEFMNSPVAIDQYAFSRNTLKNLVIPDTVVSIGYYAFANNNLNKVILPDNVDITSNTFINNEINEVVNESGTISVACFDYSSDGNAITISAFNCAGLKNVSILSAIDGLPVTTIGLRAFDSKNIENVVIPDSVTNIANYAFYKNSLKEVIIPDSVATIGSHAFSYNQLSKVKLSNNLVSLDASCFRYNNLADLVIPGSVGELKSYVFADNKLKSVKISDGVTTIGTYAFQNNILINLLLPNSVTSISNYAFNQNKLKSVIFSENLTKIGNYAFNKNNLVNVVIPSTVTSIGQRAFYKDATSNPGLIKIVNKPNTAFNWNYIVNGKSSSTFIEGTVTNDAGNVEIVVE